MEIKLNIGETELFANVLKNKNGHLDIEINNEIHHVVLRSMEAGILEAVIDGQSMLFHISNNEGVGYVSYNGHIFNVKRHDILVQEDVFGTLDIGGKEGGEIISPMPGKVIKINVKKGAEVRKGDVLLVVEAMKMENSITSPKDGKVEKINVKAGEMVDGSKELIVLAT